MAKLSLMVEFLTPYVEAISIVTQGLPCMLHLTRNVPTPLSPALSTPQLLSQLDMKISQFYPPVLYALVCLFSDSRNLILLLSSPDSSLDIVSLLSLKDDAVFASPVLAFE